ncbi:hypothetical protein FXO37_35740 [Capsicum annuum]|nr:hypothetical protein FXO37_35740 [Capsicum annuum]
MPSPPWTLRSDLPISFLLSPPATNPNGPRASPPPAMAGDTAASARSPTRQRRQHTSPVAFRHLRRESSQHASTAPTPPPRQQPLQRRHPSPPTHSDPASTFNSRETSTTTNQLRATPRFNYYLV